MRTAGSIWVAIGVGLLLAGCDYNIIVEMSDSGGPAPCQNDDECGAARQCVAGYCIPLGSDGGAGNGRTPGGDAGDSCPSDFADCDGNPSTGCETDLLTNPAHCSQCGFDCAVYRWANVSAQVCHKGTCAIGECESGTKDCNQQVSDGCETNILSDPAHCGGCSLPCGPNAICNNKACGCASGFANCNGTFSDGCEANLASDPAHCGDCATDCGPNTVCNFKTCACVLGFADCNDRYADGCEIDIQNDPENCGACGEKCGENALCSESRCVCSLGFGDCNKGAADGCETDLRLPDTCGTGCDEAVKCAPTCVSEPQCTGGQCDYTACAFDWCTDTDGDRTNGCEARDYFPKLYGGKLTDAFASIVPTSNGGFVATGHTTSSGAGGRDVWLAKLDAHGTIEWQKTYGGPKDDEATAVVRLEGGGYLAAGQTASFGAGGTDIWVIRFDENGDVVWEKALGGPGDDAARTAVATTDGSIAIAGRTRPPGGTNDGIIFKLDIDGNLVWQKSYASSYYNDSLDAIAQAADGTLYAAGQTRLAGYYYDGMWVLHLTPDGTIIWQKVYNPDGYSSSGARSMAFAADGGLAVAGFEESNLWVVAIDGDGQVFWGRFFSAANEATSIVGIPDGGFVVTAYESYADSTGTKPLALRIDVRGGFVWNRSYGSAYYDDRIRSVVRAADGGYVVAGQVRSFVADGMDGVVMKLDEEGDDYGCGLAVSMTGSTGATNVLTFDSAAEENPADLSLATTAAAAADSAALSRSVCE
ncbi:MAG: hypothetical protein HY897_20835 [Deltaproteobacteria bacterium]|nr:hypothetical protein [Deltaproteobacteria bacterium]